MKKPENNSDNPDFFSDDYQLPEEWNWISLEDAVEKVIDYRGRTPPITNQGIPHITTSNIRNGKINWKTEKFVTPETYEKYMTRGIPEPGDILFTMEGPLGEVAVLRENQKFSIAQRLLLLRAKKDILNSDFFAFALMSPNIRAAIEMKATGSGVKGVAYKRLKDLQISLPPLAEQQRVVARVEALLTHINTARDQLSRVPLIMKKFRLAVLAAACEGRLTEGWRESCGEIEPSAELFSKIQTSINEKYFESCETAKRTGGRKIKDERKNKKSEKPVIDLPELPETWNYYRLEDLSHLITDGTHVTPEYRDEGIPFLSVKNIRPFSFRISNIKLISPEEHLSINQRCNPEFQDILYTKVGSYGYAVQNKLKYPFSLFVSVALVKPVKKYFTPDYAEIVMNSPIVFEQANDRVSGSGTPDLHLIEIRDFRIPLPPVAEQYEIVRRVGLLFERADAFDQEVAVTSRRCARLTQAVLGKAFRGELTTNDSEAQ
jgi:type I restriction enzyme, S subunit